MSKTNCVNCGAAKELSDTRCPFCGTTYLDFTGIDFDSRKPVVCQFVLPNSDRTVMSMLALPVLDEFCMESTDTLEVTTLRDSYRRFISAPMEIRFGVSFHPIMQSDGSLMKYRKENE